MTATWDPNKKHANITLSNGNLTAAGISYSHRAVLGTEGKQSGKWYFEAVLQNTGHSDTIIGIATTSASLSGYIGSDAYGWGYHMSAGQKCHSGISGYGNSYNHTNVIGVAYDLDAGKIWFAKDNIWQASGNPATGVNPAFTNVSGTVYPATSIYGSGTPSLVGRFDATDFSYTPPSGFEALGVPAITYTLSGIAKFTDDAIASTVRLALHATGEHIDDIEPDQETGSFEITVDNAAHTITIFKTGYRPLTHGPVEPVEES